MQPRLELAIPIVTASLALFAGCGDGGAPNAPDPTPAASATPEAAPTSAPAAGPRLRFTALYHDFGRVSDVNDLTCTFELESVGTETAVITDIKASCGCTTTELEAREFPPGARDKLDVRWEAKGFGRQAKTVTIRSDALPEGYAQLTIKAEILPFVRVNPSPVQLGQVRMGSPHTSATTLACADENLEIRELRSLNPHIRAIVAEAESGAKRVVSIELLDSAPWGPLFGKVEVHVFGRVTPDAEPVEHKTDFLVHATVFAEVQTDQTMFAVGKLAPGDEIRYEVKLSRPSGEPFRVVDARVEQSTPAGMAVRAEPFEENGKHGQKLVLTGTTEGYQGYVRGNVVFTTDIPGEDTRTLRVAGNVVP